MKNEIQFDEKPLLLLVDDQIENLQVLGNILTDYRISITTSGRDAVRIAGEIIPDLIVLDIMMPEMNGFLTCKAIKENPDTADIPVIFVTARIQLEDMVEGFHLGAVDYITKPFEAEELLVRVKTHVDLRRARQTILWQNMHLLGLNFEKNKFLSIAAHDLKNPLKVIHGFSKLIIDKFLSFSVEEIKEFMNDIRTSAEGMLSIITNMLEVNAIDEGRLEVMTDDISVELIGEIILQDNAAHSYSKNIEILLTNETGKLSINTDFSKLRQLLDNILANAITFSPFNKKVSIVIDQHEEDNKQYVRFRIKDEGPGISEDEIPLLFEKFRKLSNRPTANEITTGLGLAIVKGYVDLLKGVVVCNSVLNQGTELTVVLPLSYD
jgi:two-component system sensor histidine kinase/response regulator